MNFQVCEQEMQDILWGMDGLGHVGTKVHCILSQPKGFMLHVLPLVIV